MVVATNNRELEEQALAERIGAGDQEAFRLLFERRGPGIYRFCLLMLGDRAGAEDIYQETFVALWKACREGKNLYSVQGYLIAVARTRCLNWLRLANRESPLDEIAEPSYEPDIGESDIGEHVHRALLRLPDQYREAIVLCEFDGYSYDEIAEALQVSRHVVKNRIHRAKKMLREILSPILRNDNDLLI